MRVSLSRTARWALACSLAGPIAWVSTGRNADASEPTTLRRPLEAWCASIVESLTKPTSCRVDLPVEPVDNYPYDGCGLETWTDTSTCGSASTVADHPAASAPLPAWYCQWFDDCGPSPSATGASASVTASSTDAGIASGARPSDLASYRGCDACDELACDDVVDDSLASDACGSASADCGDEWLMAIVAPPVDIKPATTGIVTHLVNDLRHSTGQLVALELNRLNDGLGVDLAPAVVKVAPTSPPLTALATPRPAVLSRVEAPSVAERADGKKLGRCDTRAAGRAKSVQPAQAVARRVARGWYGALAHETVGLLAATCDASIGLVRTLADEAFAWPLTITAAAEAAQNHHEAAGALEF